MALIPANGTHWIACEWRIFIRDDCPYHTAISQTYLATLVFFSVSSLTTVAIMAFRYFHWGLRFIRPSSFAWWLRPNPSEMLFVASAANNLDRLLQVVLILYGREITPPFFINFFFSFGHSVVCCLLTYYWIAL